MSIDLKAPFNGKLRVEFVGGCGNSPPFSFVIEKRAEELSLVTRQFLHESYKQSMPFGMQEQYVKEMLGLQELLQA